MKRPCASIALLVAILSSGAALAADDVEDAYLKARACAAEFKVRPEKAQAHRAWERCSDLFEDVVQGHPTSERAPQALYSAGRLRVEAWGRFKDQEDVTEAIRIMNLLVRDYPKSTLADDALFQIGRLRHNPLREDERARIAFAYIVENYPTGDMAEKARGELKALEKAAPEGSAEAPAAPAAEKPKAAPAADGQMAGPKRHAVLEAIDVADAEGETTVSLSLSRRTAYTMEYIQEGPRTRSPPRLELLLSYTDPGASLKKEIAVASRRLSKIQVRRSLLGGGVHLALELSPRTSYAVQAKGGRITVRLKESDGTRPSAPPPPPSSAPRKEKTRAAGRERAFVVVIDPGHGGSDTGAIGPSGVEEKDVTLALSRRLAERLAAEGDMRVFLTRAGDRTLSLEDRNAFAVARKADLFVSIHANASPNRKMSGIETYFLNSASDRAAEKLAKRENRSARRKVSDVEHILSTMLQTYDAAQSQLLAADVQGSLVARMGKRYAGVQNRKVRSALFYVLVGAKCPAILVEASFLSNPREERRLTQRAYQGDLAVSIADGVRRYLRANDRRMVSL